MSLGPYFVNPSATYIRTKIIENRSTKAIEAIAALAQNFTSASAGELYFSPVSFAPNFFSPYLYVSICIIVLLLWVMEWLSDDIYLFYSRKQIEVMAYQAVKSTKPGLEEPQEQVHKIRITLSSKNVKNLEKGMHFILIKSWMLTQIKCAQV